MGFAIALTSVSEADRPSILANARLSETGIDDAANETRLSGGLWQGQYITWRNTRMTKRLASPRYDLVAAGIRMLPLEVNETAMGAAVIQYENGVEIWSASGDDHGYVTQGPVPLDADALKTLCYAQSVVVFGEEKAKEYAQADGDFTDPFAMAVELFVAQTGFRYDSHDVDTFMELAGEMPFPKPWWKIW